MTTAEASLNSSFFKYQQAELGMLLDARKHPGCAKRPLGWLLLSSLSGLNIKMEIPQMAKLLLKGFVVSC